jgi:hypothetical protein
MVQGSLNGLFSSRTFCSNRDPNRLSSRKSLDEITQTSDDCTSAFDINLVLSHIQKEGETRDLPVLTNTELLKPVVELFLEYGADIDSVKEFVLAHLSVASKNLDQLESAMIFLRDYGFSVSDTFKILPVASKVFQPNRKNIINILEMLRGYKLSDKHVIHVASSAPHILNIKSAKTLSSRIDRFGEMFFHGDLVKMIVKWPQILLADAEDTRLKFDYIIEIMNMKYTQLIRSNALSCPFHHVKARHLFLLRAGLFETPDKNKETKHIQNPSIRAIMDLSDEAFVSKLGAGMSVADYQTFCNILHLEEELSDEEYESDGVVSGIEGYTKGN